MFEFDEIRIQDHASPESLDRGDSYYRQGTVMAMVERGGALHAEVAGSGFAPYKVRIYFDGAPSATCDCPYDWGGWCKHIVAVLLAHRQEPETVRRLPALGEILSKLDREQLQNVLLKLAERDPSLADVIEGEISLSASSDARPTNVDAIRRSVRSGLQTPGYVEPYGAYPHTGGNPDEARRVLDGARDFIRAGDGRAALPVLEVITEEYTEFLEAPDWEMLDDYGGELLDFLEELGAAWAEALLSADDLTPDEREDYGAKLDVWWGELGEYSAGDTFGAAFRAVEQGWSYPPLIRVLEGGIPDDEFFGEILDDPLTIARLNVLEFQGRFDEYLRLSEAAGETVGHAVTLARLGRTEAAVEYGLKRLAAPEEALAVAEALREQGEPEAALRIGERGLSLEGRKDRLAIRVRDLAEDEGNPALALEAAVVAFSAGPDLASYRRVRELSGERWLGYRAQLLGNLRQDVPYYPSGHVEIFLQDGLIEDAIAVVEKSPVEALIARVADAAVDSHPGWVIETSRRMAEKIMDEGRSKDYDTAISWLTRTRKAYLAAGRDEEWRAYRDELVDHHRRKYKLRPMLEDLAG
jgi:uncharacterized Zn finger protein